MTKPELVDLCRNACKVLGIAPHAAVVGTKEAADQTGRAKGAPPLLERVDKERSEALADLLVDMGLVEVREESAQKGGGR